MKYRFCGNDTNGFDDVDKEILVSAPLDMKVVLSINGILILVVGLMPSFWMELSVSLF